MASIGIDLGTTNSLISIFTEDGPQIIPNALGELLTPSVVGLADDKSTVLIGRAAQRRMVRFPHLTQAVFKRKMGTDAKLRLGPRLYSPVDLSAMLLGSLKSDAEAHLGHEVTEAVISVPAYFNGVQRQATKDAAEIAGLKVQRLINEPTAAALANGVLDRDGESTFVVLDLGGGTFDVSILEMFDGVMEVRSSSGDAFLGGEDFTLSVARHFADQADLDWDKLEAEPREMLVDLSERLKRGLEDKPQVSARIKLLGEEREFSLNQATFDDVTKKLMERIYRPIDRSLYDANLGPDQIDRVILVGGATRMGSIRSAAAKIFKRLPERNINPDHAIALGAAIQAGLADKHSALDDMVMTDVAPFSMGIESNHHEGEHVIHGAFAPILERNTILPASRNSFFSTAADNQTKIDVRIYQGESAMARDNILIGEMTVPVPPKPKGQESIEVRFTYDVSGLLAVDVKVLSMDKTLSTVIDNLAGAMSESEKRARLKDMERLKVAPRDQAENTAVLESLKHLFEMLLGADRDYIRSLLGRFEAALDTQDPKKIAAARKEISEIINDIEANFVR